MTLVQWFKQFKRDLPWRENPSPYAVWVSEVMLQQTQVAVVIPYFLHWMELFPTIEALAEADRTEVIKAWEGLGYYSRARNLHDGARYVVENYGGELPDQADELAKIKGLGPYTIGAILSFAFQKRVPAVDGNVIRVLTRYLGIEEDISKPKVVQRLREEALKLLPEEEPWIYSEALIELGATVCQKKAKCGQCPLKGECVAYREGMVDRLPFKSAKIQYEKLERTVAVLMHEEAFLVRKGQAGEIMNDLYEFPYFDSFVKSVEGEIKRKFGLEAAAVLMKPVSHSFTRYRAKLKPYLCKAEARKKVSGYEWIGFDELRRLPFSSGHRRILQQVLDTCKKPCGRCTSK